MSTQAPATLPPAVLVGASHTSAKPEGVLRRYLVELLWALFAAANYAAMVAWPSWETIPFHFVWISLTLLYGFRVWPPRPTFLVLAAVMTMTGFSIGLDAFSGSQLWGELYEVPLMAAMFLAMVWHARRRVEAQAIAERRAEERRSLLERQERFVHDASHELRTPMTIARGHLELACAHGIQTPEIAVALDELGRIDAILKRLLLLATADQPDFVSMTRVDIEPLLEDVFMRWAELAPRGWQLGELAGGTVRADPDRAPAGCPRRAARERGQVLRPGRADRAACPPDGAGAGGDRGPGRGLWGPRGGLDAHLRSLCPRRLGPDAFRRGGRTRARHRRRDRQGS
jgi:signal transduction histidine kinase